MSKAIICDRCKAVCAEKSATHIATKDAFVSTQLDLCTECAIEFRKFIYGKKKEVQDEAD